MVIVRRLLILVFLPLFFVLARAEEPKALKGVALVIGQSKYEHLAALPNPANDARAIAKLLSDLGFEVAQVSDGDVKKLAKSLRRFAEDAEGADAAVLYYSGHGIEAGGENWLVPVDADLDALGDASKSLVPISEVMNELKATVPIAVLLLDACRSNPFPAGALLKTEDKPEGVPLGGAGLSVPRGFTPVGGGSAESLGTVIGFAAEPGSTALDGEPGANSPYAAALIRHLAAMNGEEFGTVLRMVTEEVYLKTKAQQRPWVNESLRRQLYFGLSIDEPKGDNALINGERRQLLLTIAALPALDRKQVETIAQSDGVPMDALFGVLRALGEKDLPKDPEALKKVLFSQSAKIKEMLAERKSLDAEDPDILRLAAAADRAIGEGAIKTARMFLDQAAQKVRDTRTDIEDIERLAREKRIANAAVMAKAADAAGLEFDYLAQAKRYAEAFAWIKDTDTVLAWRYKKREADALQDYGKASGDRDGLAQSIAAYEAAIKLVPRGGQPEEWARSQNNLAMVLHIVGARETGTKNIEAAIKAYRLALEAMTRKRDPESWADMQNNLAISLAEYGLRANKESALKQAEAAYGLALDVRTRDTRPELWAETQLNLGRLFIAKSDIEKSRATLDKAIGHLNAALEVLTKESTPFAWAGAKTNLGVALRRLGERGGGPKMFEQSLRAYEDVLSVYPRDKFPIDWGLAKNNLGITLISMGQKEKGGESLPKAIKVFEEALQELTFERSPTDWAKSKTEIALAWNAIGMRTPGVADLERSAAAAAEITAKFPRETGGDQWASSTLQYGLARMLLGTRRSGKGDFEAARKSFEDSLAHYKSTDNKLLAEQAENALTMVKRFAPAPQ
jgi:uncharacterized caspase-like protein